MVGLSSPSSALTFVGTGIYLAMTITSLRQFGRLVDDEDYSEDVGMVCFEAYYFYGLRRRLIGIGVPDQSRSFRGDEPVWVVDWPWAG